MPFRPLTGEEKAEVEAKIKAVEKEIEERERYLAELQNKLVEGKWRSAC